MDQPADGARIVTDLLRRGFAAPPPPPLLRCGFAGLPPVPEPPRAGIDAAMLVRAWLDDQNFGGGPYPSYYLICGLRYDHPPRVLLDPQERRLIEGG